MFAQTVTKGTFNITIEFRRNLKNKDNLKEGDLRESSRNTLR